jgi:hypothetical protein
VVVVILVVKPHQASMAALVVLVAVLGIEVAQVLVALEHLGKDMQVVMAIIAQLHTLLVAAAVLVQLAQILLL